MIEGNLIVADLKDWEVFTCLKLNLNQVLPIVLGITANRILFTLPIAFILFILSYILVNKTAHDSADLLL